MFGLHTFGRLGGLGGGGLSSADLLALATLYFDFTANTGRISGSGGTAASFLTTTRGSTGYSDNVAGIWSSFGTNIPRITDKGILVEEARTNVVLWDRDLTNAVWTKTSITTALDQIGIDGVANSASSLTASGANGTCLQTTAIASSARWQSAWVKRITGSGVIQMTMDNGTTWTNVTVTAGWTRISIPTQTLANPVVGFRIVTNGDAVAVDFVQNENGTFATSPMLTTTAAFARGADTCIVTSFAWFVAGGPGSIFAEAVAPNGPTTPCAFVIYDTTANNRIQASLGSAKSGGLITAGGVSQLAQNPGSALAAGQISKAAMAFATNDGNIAAEGTIGTLDTTVTLPVVTSARVGHFSAGNSVWNGYVRRVAYWSSRLANAQLQTLTA